MKWPKSDFPFFTNHPTFSYLDNAATTQKPSSVLDAERQFYIQHTASIHRSAHQSAEEATHFYESARARCAAFLNVQPSEIIFTSSATAALNLVAFGWALNTLKEGDEILLSLAEHHANLIPWQQVARKTGAILKFIPVDQQGILVLESLESLVSSRTKLISVTHVSNVTGDETDVRRIIQAARTVSARVLIDASQSVPHKPLNVTQMGCDFLVFSAHKMVGPTGIGVLVIKNELQHEVMPLIFGGGAVQSVTREHAVLRSGPQKFEAGTPAAAQAVGLVAAIEYLENHSFSMLLSYEASLISYALDGLLEYPSIRILGNPSRLRSEGHLVSFVIPHIHAHDAAAYFDRCGVALRAGNHCAQPLHDALGISASLRLSVAGYNERSDIEKFLSVLNDLMSL